jgi:hypothetical protein
MTWDGDISRMGKLADRVADLARVPSRVAARVAGDLRDLIEQEFATGTDPYGRPWAPLAEFTLEKRTQVSEPPLTDTGSMRGALDVRPMRGAGVSITIPHPAEDHQTGWDGPVGSGPERPILPNAGMPEAWKRAIEGVATVEVRKAVGQ